MTKKKQAEQSDTNTYAVVETRSRGIGSDTIQLIYVCLDKDDAVSICTEYAYGQADMYAQNSVYVRRGVRIFSAVHANDAVFALTVSVSGEPYRTFEVRELTNSKYKQPWKL